MQRVIATAMLALLPAPQAMAQTAVPGIVEIPAPAEPDALPLYGDKTTGSVSSEIWGHVFGGLSVRNVTRPTITPVVPASGKATGAAVVIVPGGAFIEVEMETEGGRVARALADRGITAFIVKYRTVPPADQAQFFGAMRQAKIDPTKMPNFGYPPSTDDALAALSFVRSRAADWGVDPRRVGILGFSAGAVASLGATVTARPGERPAFIGYVYGPMAGISVPADAPPMFAAIAFDDQNLPIMGFPLVEAWHQAKRPVELHAYGRGGHGFGLGRPDTTTMLFMDEFVTWLGVEGFLVRKDDK